MGSLLLLRSFSSLSRTGRLVITALGHRLPEKFVPGNVLISPHIYNYTAATTTRKAAAPLPLLTRSFHVGRFLRAAYAVADLSDAEDSMVSSEVAADGLEISKLGISPEIVSALAGRGIDKLFPIQGAVLEPAMKGRDMIGRARTGTGKTLAFGIPIMDKIIRFNEKHGRGRNPLALILAPTRELARQVDKEFCDSAPNLDTLCVYGGMPISRQIDTLKHGVDVIVGTPGRVIDLIKRGSLTLSEVQFVVLDEADQMLNVGFADAVETILGYMTQKHQTMMFSATMPNWIIKLTQKFLKNPVTVDLVGDSDQKLAEGISLYAIASEMREKPAIIGTLINEHAKGGKCIVFTQTKRNADQLASAMQRNFSCEALHGDIAQNQRERTLSGFRDGRFNILVATDVAARGLDVPNVDLEIPLSVLSAKESMGNLCNQSGMALVVGSTLVVTLLQGVLALNHLRCRCNSSSTLGISLNIFTVQVIHYELPNSSEIFVHRSGRTGRAMKKGSAIVIYSSHQYRDIKAIEREVGCQFVELPKIAVKDEAMDMYSAMNSGGSRFGSRGNMGGAQFRDSGFGYSGGYGNSEGGRVGGSSSGGRLGGQRSRNFGGFGNLGGSDRSNGFGNLGGPSRSSGFGDFGSGHSSGFGDVRRGQNTHSSRFGRGDNNDGNF